MMLYTVNNSTITTDDLNSLLLIAPSGSPILLYEDGIYSAAAGTRHADNMKVALQSHPVYALEADLAARGINNLIEGIQVINYDGFVELVEQHNVIPWLRS
jgi:tRNA 2-thiouridine synthesizing protein B